MGKKKKYETLKTTPFDTGIKNFTIIAKYFMYYAPNIDSVHSTGKIEGKRATSIMENMMNLAGCKKNKEFSTSLSACDWGRYDLDSDEIDFEIAKIVCHKKRNEQTLTALLRHIRNSLAHGNIYIWRKSKGDFVFMLDKDSRNGKETAKIVTSKLILENWKALLEQEIATGE